MAGRSKIAAKKPPKTPAKSIGRPQHKPTVDSRRRVRVLAAHGNPEATIAAVEGIARETLRKHYAAEIGQGRHQGDAKLRATMFLRATSGSDRMLEHLSRTRLHAVETTRHEIAGTLSFAERIAARQVFAHREEREED